MTRGRKSWQEIKPKYFDLAFYSTYVLHLFPFMNVLARQEGAGMKKWNLAGKKIPVILVLLLENKFPCHWMVVLT